MKRQPLPFSPFDQLISWPARWAENRLARLFVGGALLVLVVALGYAAFARSPAMPPPVPPAQPLAGGASPRVAPLPGHLAGGETSLGAVEPDWPAVLLDLGGKLLLTLGLLYGTLYLLRRYGGRIAGQRQARSVAVVETVHLGQHRDLHLVRVGSRFILLGATTSQISFLAEVANPGDGAPAETTPPPVESSFADQLRSFATVGSRPPDGR